MRISNEQYADAVQNGELATVKSVLDDDPAMVSFQFDSNNSPLQLAASRGHFDVAQLLVERGADVKATGDQGMTALHYAVDAHYDKIVDLLIANGADVNLVDARGLSPIAAAARQFIDDDLTEEGAVFDALIAAGAYYDLTAACLMCDIERVAEILEENPNAARDVSPSHFLLPGLIYSERGGFDEQREILDLLFDHGYRPSSEEFEQSIAGCEAHGQMDELVEYLREQFG